MYNRVKKKSDHTFAKMLPELRNALVQRIPIELPRKVICKKEKRP